jgi:hypothetical protein
MLNYRGYHSDDERPPSLDESDHFEHVGDALAGANNDFDSMSCDSCRRFYYSDEDYSDEEDSILERSPSLSMSCDFSPSFDDSDEDYNEDQDSIPESLPSPSTATSTSSGATEESFGDAPTETTSESDHDIDYDAGSDYESGRDSDVL